MGHPADDPATNSRGREQGQQRSRSHGGIAELNVAGRDQSPCVPMPISLTQPSASEKDPARRRAADRTRPRTAALQQHTGRRGPGAENTEEAAGRAAAETEAANRPAGGEEGPRDSRRGREMRPRERLALWGRASTPSRLRPAFDPWSGDGGLTSSRCRPRPKKKVQLGSVLGLDGTHRPAKRSPRDQGRLDAGARENDGLSLPTQKCRVLSAAPQHRGQHQASWGSLATRPLSPPRLSLVSAGDAGLHGRKGRDSRRPPRTRHAPETNQEALNAAPGPRT